MPVNDVPQRQSEVEAYVSLLQRRRQEVRLLLESLSPEALNWLPLPTPPGQPKTVNSIYQMAYHSLVTEIDWRRHIAYRLGRITREEDEEGFETGEFEVVADDIDPFLRRMDHEGAATDAFLFELAESDLSVTWLNPRGERRSVRWIVGHIIAHYGEHIGQMALTRQWWEESGRR
jgi:hypothetical protein